MLLTQMSASDALTRSVLRAMMMYSSVLEFAQFYRMVGNADDLRKTSVADGGQNRSVNEDYSPVEVDPVYARPSLKILGGKVKTDIAYERRGYDVPSVRAADLVRFAEGIGRKFQDLMFNGSTAGNPEQPNGLKILTPASQTIQLGAAGGNGLVIPAGNGNAERKAQQEFLEALDQLIEKVEGGAQAVFMDGKLHARTTSIATNYIEWMKDEFGQNVAFYNGVPLRRAGFTDRPQAEANRVLGYNETVGTSVDCTSVFACRFGEMNDLTVASNVGVQVKDMMLVGIHYTYLIDFDIDNALVNDRSVARLTGARLG